MQKRFYYSIFFFTIALFSGLIAFSQNNPIDSLKGLLKTKLPDTTRVNVLVKIAFIDKSTNPTEGLKLAQEAKTLAEKSKFEKGLADAYNMIAVSNFFMGNYKEALPNNFKSLEIKKKLKLPVGIGFSQINIGLAYWKLGQYDKATEFLIQSLKTFESIGHKDKIAMSTVNLGIIYYEQNLFDKSLVYYLKGKALFEELGQEAYLANMDLNIGNIYYRKKEYAKALEYYEHAVPIQEKYNMQWELAVAISNIGNIYKEQNENKKALQYFLRAHNIREELNDQQGLATSHFNLALAYIGLKDYVKAEQNLKRAQVLAIQTDSKDDLKNIYSGFEMLYSKVGKFELALEYADSLMAIKDTILNEANADKIAEMSSLYESEKKEKEIELLNKSKKLQEVEISKKRVQQNYLFGIVALVLLVVVVLFVGLNNKKKANKALTILNNDIKEKSEEIKQQNEELNQQNEEIAAQRDEIEKQKELVEHTNKEITDSIHYAKRIQKALLTSNGYFQKYLNDFFIHYNPKDIVSGDFYWALSNPNNNKEFLMAVADCTGHGVPGAFMSMLGLSFLNEITIEKKITSPELILNELRREIISSLNPEDAEEESKDGMDIVLFSINFDTLILKVAAANNPLWIVRKESALPKIIEIKANKFPVGKYADVMLPFTMQEIQLQKNDIIYAFSDGYADQFGGEKGKKFKYKQLEDLLSNIYDKPLNEQKTIIKDIFEDWKNVNEQVDDILVVGVKI